MADIKHTARRYLLGELTEAEQSALEETYFNDAQVFAEVASEENTLVDDYVRGRLAPETRRRFETVYLSRPERRARVEFAEALLSRADASPAPSIGDRPESPRAHWLTTWLGPRPALAMATLAAAIILGIAVWTALRSTRQEPEQQQTTIERVTVDAHRSAARADGRSHAFNRHPRDDGWGGPAKQQPQRADDVGHSRQHGHGASRTHAPRTRLRPLSHHRQGHRRRGSLAARRLETESGAGGTGVYD